MRKGFLIYEEMRKYVPMYEEAVSHIWLCNCSILNFLIYEGNFLFFFISVDYSSILQFSTYNATFLNSFTYFLCYRLNSDASQIFKSITYGTHYFYQRTLFYLAYQHFKVRNSEQRYYKCNLDGCIWGTEWIMGCGRSRPGAFTQLTPPLPPLPPVPPSHHLELPTFQLAWR